MPREVKAYLCAHRCGRRACCDRASVERHEATCFLNPARRSCKTCEHERLEDGWERECAFDAGPDCYPLDDYCAGGKAAPLAEGDFNQIAVNCKHWEPSKARFPNGVDVPPWEPLPKPEPERMGF